MPPVVIGIIQTLTEGQSVTDKLLGLCLISQLLLFCLTLQLNRETELLIYFITEEEEKEEDEEEERKRNMKKIVEEYRERIQKKIKKMKRKRRVK